MLIVNHYFAQVDLFYKLIKLYNKILNFFIDITVTTWFYTLHIVGSVRGV